MSRDVKAAAKERVRPLVKKLLAVTERKKAAIVEAESRVAHWKMLRRRFRDNAEGGLTFSRAQYDDAQGDAFIVRARSGDPVAVRALRSVVMHLIETNERMPPNLATYVDDILSRGLPKLRSGKVANLEAARIVDGISLVIEVEFGFTFKPTRNDATARPSACGIIAEVWGELIGETVPESRVKELWKQRKGPRARSSRKARA